MTRSALLAPVAALLLGACGGSDAEKVGEFANDWTGNEIVIEALADPKVAGVTCHLTHFDRSLIDRVTKGNWFEDPSNASIACRQTGQIDLADLDDIDQDGNGEEIFSQRQSLIFKNLAVRRVWDAKHTTLVYVAYSRRPIEGSAKMSVSTVPLFRAQEAAQAPAGAP